VPDWEPVIGLEIHVQLKTRTKMFCRCATGFGAGPNTQTCPVCLAHPGALPVPNELAVAWTIKLGLALGCHIAEHAVFHRKNYFYPDNPKGYQISQYDEPLCIDGTFVVPGPDGDITVGIVRAHLEEDAAKTIHVGGATGRIVGAAHSNVDFNRAGTPLVEIVTRPDIHSADEARRFLQLLRQTIVELGISDAEMEKGTLRADANVSVRERGETGYRTRTELKNMNSFNHIARGIDAEIRRQISTWESGGEVVQQTLDYEVKSDTVTPRRSKEEADDYRYFPEPDLVPIEPPRELIDRLRGEVTELPGARIGRLSETLGFETALELVATGNERTALLLVEHGLDWPTAANVAMNQLAGREPLRENARALVAIINARDQITRDAYNASFASSTTTVLDVEEVLNQRAVGEASELEPVIEKILDENPAQVDSYRGGKQGVLGFFVGQVMKETQGKADPKVVNDLLREKLNEQR
jgi:aspartyl-tRNA(Asn)/glutamyl-tRNA(Gln) amidotransferase subunit B